MPNQPVPPLPPHQDKNFSLPGVVIGVVLVMVACIFWVILKSEPVKYSQDNNQNALQNTQIPEGSLSAEEELTESQKNLAYLYARVIVDSIKIGEEYKYDVFFYNPETSVNQLIDTVVMKPGANMYYHEGKIYYIYDLHENGMIYRKTQIIAYDVKTRTRATIYESTRTSVGGGFLAGLAFNDNKVYFMECRYKPQDVSPYGIGSDRCDMKAAQLAASGEAENLQDLGTSFESTYTGKFFSPFFGIDSFLFPKDGIVVIENSSDKDIRERYKFSYNNSSFVKMTDAQVKTLNDAMEKTSKYRCAKDTEGSGILESQRVGDGNYPPMRIGCFDATELAGLIPGQP